MQIKNNGSDVGSILPRPKKKFGQNFLTDPGYASRIVELASISSSDTVIEIGPGRGAITKLLAKKGCRVIALELDRELITNLGDTFVTYNNVEVVETDALKFDFSSLKESCHSKVKVVANLPYNVATPILFKLFEHRDLIGKMVLMFQLEVAKRIVASPGGKDYGALSIFPQLYSDASLAFKLPPGAFFPAPKIFSAVIHFEVFENPRYDVKDVKMLERVVKTAFSQRRKKLSNSIKSLLGKEMNSDELFVEAGIDASKRPEELTVEEFCRLSDALLILNRI